MTLEVLLTMQFFNGGYITLNPSFYGTETAQFRPCQTEMAAFEPCDPELHERGNS